METKTVKEVYEKAIDENQDKIPVWIIIDCVNEMLLKARLNGRFELSQQNRYNHNDKSEGTLLTGIFHDCEKSY